MRDRLSGVKKGLPPFYAGDRHALAFRDDGRCRQERNAARSRASGHMSYWPTSPSGRRFSSPRTNSDPSISLLPLRIGFASWFTSNCDFNDRSTIPFRRSVSMLRRSRRRWLYCRTIPGSTEGSFGAKGHCCSTLSRPMEIPARSGSSPAPRSKAYDEPAKCGCGVLR